MALNIPVDVNTVFNLYRITYVQTWDCEGNACTPSAKPRRTLVMARNEQGAKHWFRESFECNAAGDLFDLLHITHVNQGDWIHLFFEDYYHGNDTETL